MQQIDLNCDMGEGFANDTVLMDYISSANIACGFHAGNAETMQHTVSLAIGKGVAIGAHPGFPDLEGFGRREMKVSADEVYRMVFDQIEVLNGFVNAAQGKLHHVKPHGALYNMAAKNVELAKAVAQAVYDFDAGLILYTLAGSEMIVAATEMGLKTASEVFADRTYQDDGSLTTRSQNNALITDEQQSIEQVMMMVKEQQVLSVNKKVFPLKAETLCLHGDGVHAVDFARLINAKLKEQNVAIKAPQHG